MTSSNKSVLSNLYTVLGQFGFTVMMAEPKEMI
jgi:hypothetical protein